MAIIHAIFVVLLVFIVLKIYLKYRTTWCTSKVCLAGKTVIVTGANTGIGYETALEFAKRGAKVILGCRSESKANEARDKIIQETKNHNVHVELVDMASLPSVRSFAERVLQKENRLDILVNNAGMGAAKNKLTDDGYRNLLQINYLGPFLLTILLLDLLKKSAPSRIVNVSSIAAKYGTVDAYKLNTYPGPWQDYNKTKLLNVLFTMRLADLLKDSNVSVFSLHPGAIQTEIFRAIKGWKKNILDLVMSIYFKSPEEGAQTTLYTSLEQGLEKHTGCHFAECKIETTYPSAQDPELKKMAFEKTVELLNCEDEVRKVLTYCVEGTESTYLHRNNTCTTYISMKRKPGNLTTTSNHQLPVRSVSLRNTNSSRRSRYQNVLDEQI